MFLSAGEESLSALMARAGKKASAGQEIRLADIEADAGAGMGAFEALNAHATPSALAVALKDAASLYHGAAGVEWLRCIVTDRLQLIDIIRDEIKQFVEEAVPKDAAGQVLRVARRFGLVAVAGELATHYGLTGWPKGEAEFSVKKCFAAWLESFGGTGNREERAMLSQVRAFFEAHGASRFEDVNSDKDQRILNRAGFYRYVNGVLEYMVLPESFRREVCKGFDVKIATRALVDAGWLAQGEGGRSTKKPRIPVIGERFVKAGSCHASFAGGDAERVDKIGRVAGFRNFLQKSGNVIFRFQIFGDVKRFGFDGHGSILQLINHCAGGFEIPLLAGFVPAAQQKDNLQVADVF